MAAFSILGAAEYLTSIVAPKSYRAEKSPIHLMRKAFADLPADTAILAGELCLVDLRGGRSSGR